MQTTHNIQKSHHPETDSFNNSSALTENAKKTHQLQVVQKTHHTSLCRAVVCLARLNDVSTVAPRDRSVLMSTRVWMGMCKEPLKFKPLNCWIHPGGLLVQNKAQGNTRSRPFKAHPLSPPTKTLARLRDVDHHATSSIQGRHTGQTLAILKVLHTRSCLSWKLHTKGLLCPCEN